MNLFIWGLLLGALIGSGAVFLWRRRADSALPAPPPPEREGSREPSREPATRAFLGLGPAEEGPADAGPANLKALEAALDEGIQGGLALLHDKFPRSKTVGLFLPGRGEGWILRLWSTRSPAIRAGARLLPSQGLLARLMKEETARILEGDIVAPSEQLGYYDGPETVRSLAAVPLTADGKRRGALFMDSEEPGAYTAQDLALLEGMARLLAHTANQSYRAYDFKTRLRQMEQVSGYQRRFLEELSVEKIAEEVSHCMRDLLDADRYLLLAKEPGGEEVAILKDMGHLGALIEGVRFALKDSPLLRLVFDKEQILNRGLQIGETLLHGVPPGADVRGPMGALAVPVPTDKGVEMALIVVSAQRRKVSDHHQQLLAAIGRAAGFALSRARWYQEKADLASRDGLTGALNHRAFKERLGEELLRAQRYGQKFALLMVDIDFFKRINDTYGHPVGDQVLRGTASILAENVRGGVDLVARYGGEEFVLLLTDTDGEGARDTGERIRKALESREFEAGNQRFRATASIGGAVFPEDGRRAQEVLERADKALYRAKETGRNKVVLYH